MALSERTSPRACGSRRGCTPPAARWANDGAFSRTPGDDRAVDVPQGRMRGECNRRAARRMADSRPPRPRWPLAGKARQFAAGTELQRGDGEQAQARANGVRQRRSRRRWGKGRASAPLRDKQSAGPKAADEEDQRLGPERNNQTWITCAISGAGRRRRRGHRASDPSRGFPDDARKAPAPARQGCRHSARSSAQSATAPAIRGKGEVHAGVVARLRGRSTEALAQPSHAVDGKRLQTPREQPVRRPACARGWRGTADADRAVEHRRLLCRCQLTNIAARLR